MVQSYSSKRAHHAIALTLVTIMVDVAALYSAFVAAYFLRVVEAKPVSAYVPFESFLLYVAIMAPPWVLILAGCGLYSTRQSHGWLGETGRVVISVTLGVMVLIVLDYYSFDLPLFPGRKVPLYALALGIALVLLGRLVVRLGLRVLQARGRGLHNIIMLGTGPLAERLASELLDAGRGHSIVAAVSPTAAGEVFAGRPVYASVDQALASHRVRIDEIISTDVEMSRAEATRLMALANELGMGYRFVPDLYGVFAASSTMSTIAGVPVMEVRLTSLDGWATVGKRVVDIVGSLVGIFLLAPLFLVIAALIKLTDPAGPVLYRQQRLGRGGRVIGIYKFRSMRWEYSTGPDRPYRTAAEAFLAMGRPDLVAEFETAQKVTEDPRISKLGVFLRRTSLDELPQLFNALLGQLSLVGPRPITSVELERYGQHQHSFLALKPGITGLWQVSGRSDLGYDQRVMLDVHYVENWSAMLDMMILARTVATVAARRGAY